MTAKKTRSLISVFLVAVILNYLWELAQAPLYVGLGRYDAGVFWRCFVASLGDGVMVLFIVAVDRISFHRWDWFQQPGVAGYVVMLAVGFVFAVVVEWVAIYVLVRWQYTDQMLLLPGLRISLAPIAQMLILPPVVFQIVTILQRTSKVLGVKKRISGTPCGRRYEFSSIGPLNLRLRLRSWSGYVRQLTFV